MLEFHISIFNLISMWLMDERCFSLNLGFTRGYNVMFNDTESVSASLHSAEAM